jgi:hypothetical protein
MDNRNTGIIVCALAFIVIWGGTQVIYPLGMGMVIFLTFMVIYSQLPIWMRKMFARIHLVIDALMTYVSYRAIGAHTATALFAAAIVGLCVTLFLLSERRRLLGKQTDLKHVMQRVNWQDEKALETLYEAQAKERAEYSQHN